MARTKAQLSAGVRLADYLTVGYLAMRCPVCYPPCRFESKPIHPEFGRPLPLASWWFGYNVCRSVTVTDPTTIYTLTLG
jgi:hypothetical protein